MATTFRFEHNGPMSACHLGSTDDEGSAFVFCAIPGGTPVFQLDPKSQTSHTIVGAPACDTHREFVAFVKARFADDPEKSAR